MAKVTDKELRNKAARQIAEILVACDILAANGFDDFTNEMSEPCDEIANEAAYAIFGQDGDDEEYEKAITSIERHSLVLKVKLARAWRRAAKEVQ
jgi:hypothetical protein